MNSERSGSGPDPGNLSWATEALPMSVRKELLERELRKLGFRKAAAHGSGHAGDSSSDSGSGDQGHPQAANGAEPHGG